VRSLLGSLFEKRDLTAFGPYVGDPSRIPMNGETYSNASGMVVTEESALRLATVWACVRLLADSIASLPWAAYGQQGDQRVRLDPQPSLLRAPFDDLTRFDWVHMLVASLVVRGNSYGLITQRDYREFPTEIMPLHPDHVRVERDANGQKRYRLPSGEPIPRADILHVRLFPQAGLDVSPSPIQVARETIGLGLAAQAFGARWFGEGAAPSSMLTTDQPLSDTQVKQLKSEWIATHGGRRQPAILAGGLKWEPITITPEESQFLETRKFQRAEIASLFRVPPHMIGDLDRTTSWGTGIEQQSIGFVVHTLRPYLERIEGALTRLLPGQQFVKFNVDGLLRGDTPARYTAYQQALDGGWMNPDEVRALEDRPPIPGGAGKKYRQPLNYGPLGYDPTTQPAPAGPASDPVPVSEDLPSASPGKTTSSAPKEG
jgi:HK97 family phage portal protein